jgi:hypothetical protein
VNSDSLVHALKIGSTNSSLSVLSEAEELPLGQAGPTIRGHTGQSGAPKIAKPISFPLVFLTRFRSNL